MYWKKRVNARCWRAFSNSKRICVLRKMCQHSTSMHSFKRTCNYVLEKARQRYMLMHCLKFRTYLRLAKNVSTFYIDDLFQTKMYLCIGKSAATLDVDTLSQTQNVSAFYGKCVNILHRCPLSNENVTMYWKKRVNARCWRAFSNPTRICTLQKNVSDFYIDAPFQTKM